MEVSKLSAETLIEGVILYINYFWASLKDTVETEATITCP